MTPRFTTITDLTAHVRDLAGPLAGITADHVLVARREVGVLYEEIDDAALEAIYARALALALADADAVVRS